MSDPNMADFYQRVRRIEKARAKGYGHEAYGALGRSYYAKPARKSSSLPRGILFALVCVFALKGAIHNYIGAESYNDRVFALQAGEGVDKFGGWLMQEEPVTLWVSEKVGALRTKF